MGTFLTLGLGNGTFNGSISVLMLTGLASGESAARGEEGAAWYIPLVACLNMLAGR